MPLFPTFFLVVVDPDILELLVVESVHYGRHTHTHTHRHTKSATNCTDICFAVFSQAENRYNGNTTEMIFRNF